MRSPNILIVVSEFNREITNSLLEGAISTLEQKNVPKERIKTVWVPGAFELPLIAQIGAQNPRYDGVICLGCVIRGETPHFDYVCEQAAQGIMQASLTSKKPVIFGVLTTSNLLQAQERAGLAPINKSVLEKISMKDATETMSNKGVDCANALLQMLHVVEEVTP